VHAIAPQLTSRLTVKLTDLALQRADPALISNGNLFEPSRFPAIDGGYRTPMTRALPVAAMALVGTLGLGVLWALCARRSRRQFG
jgi:hypothetical protein